LSEKGFKAIVIAANIVILLLIASELFGATATWDPVDEAIGYTLRCKDVETDIEYRISSTETGVEIPLRPGRTYDCTIEAYNAVGKSSPSDAVRIRIPPAYTPPADSLPADLPAPGRVNGLYMEA